MMNDEQLAALVDAEYQNGLGRDTGSISDDREEIWDRYMGERYGNEREGESAVTTREIMETIEWTLPALMRHFASNETPVEFEAEDGEDEVAAKIETEAVKRAFWRDNPGFTLLYLMFKTVLMNPNGYIKVFREERDRVVFEHYQGMTLDDISLIEDDPELEMIQAEEQDENPDPVLGQRYKVKVRRKLTRGRNLVLVLPENEVVVHKEWQQLDLEECPFVCHAPEKTQSELMEMGVPESLLDEIYGAGENPDSEESNRETRTDETGELQAYDHKAMRKFVYYECAMMVDYDEDGIAERRRVVKINGHIWENEEDDEQPIISAASILMPHKHVGMSLAETILDLQEISTEIWRQTLNNMYRMNNPRTIVTKGANLADVLANRADGIIRAKSRDDISIEETRPVINQVIPLMGLLEQAREMRTGITKNSTVPDQDMMRDTAQGSFLAMVEKADQRIDLLARLLGETIVKPIYLKLHSLVKRHGDLHELKYNGVWIQTDPTSWRERYSMTVRVGLGYSSRQARLVAAKTIIADHNYLLEKGAIAKPEQGVRGVVTLGNIYAGRRLLVESLGEDVSQYYTDPMQIPEMPQAPPPPDPQLLMIQSNERIEGGKRQVEMMKLQAEQLGKRVQMQADMALEQRKLMFSELERKYEERIKEVNQEMAMAGQADKMQNERMRMELEALKAQLADAQKDEQIALDRYKADLAAETQLTIERMKLGIQSIGDIENVSESQRALEAQQASVNEAVSRLSSMIREMAQPKEIAYDDDGEIIGVRNPQTGEIRPLRRDEQGNPIGL